MKQNNIPLLLLSTTVLLPNMVECQEVSKRQASPPQRRGNLPSRGGTKRTSQDETLVPLIFPVLGKVDWSDTFNLDTMSGKRVHHGEDLMAPKMRPLVAVFDGTVQLAIANSPAGHNRITLIGDNGYTAKYMHLNIDTPGTTDGNGTPE